MPLSFLYYHIAEQWRLAQGKNGRGRKNLSRLPSNHSRFQTGKNADLSLWPNAISATISSSQKSRTQKI
jgi:hypothetical protein